MIRTLRLGYDSPNLLRRLDKVRIGKVGVAHRGPMSPMTEQLADQEQVLTRHHGLAGGGMPQVVQAKAAELRVVAYLPPARCEAIRSPTFGVARKQERSGVARSGKRLDVRSRGLAERHGARAGLRVWQIDGVGPDGRTSGD